MTVEEATLADVEALAVMAEHFITETPYRHHLAVNPTRIREGLQQCVRGQLGTASAVLVLRGPGGLVGMIGVMLCVHPYSDEPVAGDLFWWMEPAYRGHGLRLLRAAEVWARAQGARRFQMVAPTEDVARIYRAFGYHPLEQTFERSL